ISFYISCCIFSGFISNLTIQRQYFPTDEDQTGAAKALLRLQDTYKLDANTISTGDLPGVKHKNRMTVEDCYELGKVAYTEADYYHTELWMAQALRQLEEGEESPLDKVTVLDYLSYAIYQQGELERALDYTKKLLQLGESVIQTKLFCSITDAKQWVLLCCGDPERDKPKVNYYIVQALILQNCLKKNPMIKPQ
ncbi:prolyl 4-hydroxylase subunit alpha-1-like, partial [Oryzias melastigma]|uniref:prolyl 4-hydroxylase subunit alpha-1-like n=1 Tax=Oryzias melastigma TaxID=30732 RepID=UPI00168D2586